MTADKKTPIRLPTLFKIEGLSAIAVVFALFFTNGYVYLETLSTRLDAPINRLGFSNQIYAVYGGVSFLVIMAASFIALSVIMFATYVMALAENPENEASKDNWLKNMLTKAAGKLSKRHARTKQFLFVTVLAISLAAVLYGFWKITVSSAIERAEKQAFEFATTCTQSVIFLNNTTRMGACIVGESDDNLYLLFKGKVKNKRVDFETGLLPKRYLAMTRKPSHLADD